MTRPQDYDDKINAFPDRDPEDDGGVKWQQGTKKTSKSHRTSWLKIAEYILDKIGPVDPGLPVIKWEDVHRPGYIVRTLFPQSGDPEYPILGGLLGTHYNEDGTVELRAEENENALWLAAVVMDETESNIVALRPLPIHASVVDILAPEIAVTGMGLPANNYGYTLEVLDDGRTVVAVPKPSPPYLLISTGTSDHNLTTNPDTWIKITSESDPIGAGESFNPGDLLTYRAYVSENGNEGGTVTFAIGVDNTAPAVSGIQVQVNAGTKFTAAGTYELLSTLNAGQTFALWAKGVGAGAPQQQFSGLWVYKQTNGNPGAGEMNHQDSGAQIRVHKTDANDRDRSTEVEAVPIGATIAMQGGGTWTVTGVSDNGSHMRFDVTPTTRSPEDETDFTFTWTPPSNADINILGSEEPSYIKLENRP